MTPSMTAEEETNRSALLRSPRPMTLAWITVVRGVMGDRPRPRPQMALLGLVFLIGLVLPLVWVPYIALAFRKSGLRMGARASAFYAEREAKRPGSRYGRLRPCGLQCARGSLGRWR